MRRVEALAPCHHRPGPPRRPHRLEEVGAVAGDDDLAEGDVATIGFDGQVAESYPGQATAATVDVRA